MRLLIDMNLSPGWVAYLNTAGFAASHWTDIGPIDAHDSVIMDHARDNDFIVMTHDLDFGAILAATRGRSPSVVQLRADDLSIGAIGANVIAALKQLADVLQEGALVTIEPARTRMAVLPLSSGSDSA